MFSNLPHTVPSLICVFYRIYKQACHLSGNFWHILLYEFEI